MVESIVSSLSSNTNNVAVVAVGCIIIAVVGTFLRNSSRNKVDVSKSEDGTKSRKLPPTVGTKTNFSTNRRNNNNNLCPNNNNLENKNDRNEANNSSNDTNEPVDAWEERRRRGIAIHSLHEKKDVNKNQKPFGSSYYYAHNNTKAKGGYSDGLRMEDYTMNGPRLLSRSSSNMKASEQQQSATNDTEESNEQRQEEDQSSASNTNNREIEPTTAPSKEPSKRILIISKYLWDDPGSSNGEATIRIDQLPKTTTEMIQWEDFMKQNAGVTVSADVCNTNEGLLVTVKSTTSSIDYKLHINKLYGPITSVKAIMKSKRLIIKLTKQYALFNKSNLKPWPHPQKKLI